MNTNKEDEIDLSYKNNSNYVEIPNEKRCNCRCIWCGWPQNMKPP